MDSTQASIKNNSVNDISRQRNWAFLSVVWKTVEKKLEESLKWSDGQWLTLEGVISVVSMVIEDIIDQNPLEKACEEIGIKYKQVPWVSKTFLIPEIDWETVFISGLMPEHEEDLDMKKEKDIYELLTESKKLWWKRIMIAANWDNDKKNRVFNWKWNWSHDETALNMLKRLGWINEKPAEKAPIELEIWNEIDLKDELEPKEYIFSPKRTSSYSVDSEYILIPMWKEFLEKSMPELWKIWILEKDWAINFDHCEADHSMWPEINWVKLIYFPDCNFNQNHWIWNFNWKVLKISELMKMFECLWFRVSRTAVKAQDKPKIQVNLTEDKYKENIPVWKKQLEDAKAELEEKTWIIEENWIWYFCDCNGSSERSWHYNVIASLWKRLRVFPDQDFNKEFWFWNIRWEIMDEADLKKIFTKLWMQVADSEQESYMVNKRLVPRWKKQLEDAKAELEEKTWIIEENWIWYFCDCNGSSATSWHYNIIESLWKKLTSFPNQVFNKEAWIWNHKWQILNEADLKKIFMKLWLQVANPAQESYMVNKKLVPRWKRQLEDAKAELEEKAWVIEDGWVWYFCDCRTYQWWPDIDWVNLCSFPNCTFNKANKLWNDAWQIKSIEKLKELFERLWFNIADKKQEEAKELELLERSYPLWRSQIIEAKTLLETEAWIVEIDWKWYFCKCSWKDKWPEVGWKKLPYFTSKIFRRIHWIWFERRQFEHVIEIKAVFEVLWFTVADNAGELKMLPIIMERRRKLKLK
jgi:hypothetical protein